jgi:hypothetical protein
MGANTMRLFLILLVILVCSDECHAQVKARFTGDAVATCQQPAVTNFPIHIEGVGTLSTRGQGNLDVYNNVTGAESYQVRLGARPTEAPGGSASLRVTGRSSLRAIRDYPNNYSVIKLRIVGAVCTMSVENILKPGKRQYTFVAGDGSTAYCSKPIVTRANCTPY